MEKIILIKVSYTNATKVIDNVYIKISSTIKNLSSIKLLFKRNILGDDQICRLYLFINDERLSCSFLRLLNMV